MKNIRFLSFLLLCLTCSYAFSQTTSLIPSEVYIGDTAEIRFTFPWNEDIFANSPDAEKKVFFSDLDKSLSHDYTIKSMELFNTTKGYVLSIIFSPWKTGPLDLEPLDISAIFNVEGKSLVIDIPEIEIQSIFNAVNVIKEIQAPSGPVVMPGTSYIIIVCIAIILIIILLIIIVLIHFKSIKKQTACIFSQVFKSGNIKKTNKQLTFLLKNVHSLELQDFASHLSQIIRLYLEKRLAHPFTAETTSNFPHVFESILEKNSQAETRTNVNTLFEICTLCDFFHYAGIEAEKKTVTIEERIKLLNKTQVACLFLEKETIANV